jgi:phosphatidylglycerophosphate synthase
MLNLYQFWDILSHATHVAGTIMNREMSQDVPNRRPIKTRNTGWATRIAGMLARAGIKPNWISIGSVAMACGAGACLVAAGQIDRVGWSVFFYLMGATFIQLRLLCNLFDGMVAVEGGMKSASGEIFNDFPDRLADPIILVCAGYGLSGWIPHGVELGYIAGLAAVFVAYVRVLGVSTGTAQHFLGPMAKQHRMAIITIAAIASVPELFYWPFHWPRGAVMATALVLIVLGSAATVVRRVVVIVEELESS